MIPQGYFESLIDIKQYEQKKFIGHGSFGSVFLVQNIKTGEYNAAKILNMNYDDQPSKKDIDREITIMMCSNHPAIIKFIGFSMIDFQNNDNITIIMEYAKNFSLFDVLSKVRQNKIHENFTNTSRQIILIGIANAMKYLHDRSVIHRDLKSLNILIDENFHPKVTDFGLARFFDISKSSLNATHTGTAFYISPEIILGKKYNKSVDVYSFAIIMYEVVTGLRPYSNIDISNQLRFLNRIACEDLRPEFICDVKKSHKQLIEKCWSTDPKNRPTFNEIYQKLISSDYFFDNVDTNEINLYVQSISNINDPVGVLLKRIELYEKENTQLINEKSQLSSEVNQLKKDKALLSGQILQLNEDRERLKSENAQMKEKLSQISRNNTMKDDEPKSDNESGSSKFEDCQHQNEKNQDDINDLNIEVKLDSTKMDESSNNDKIDLLNINQIINEWENDEINFHQASDKKNTIKVAIIGHENSGKSTLIGHLLELVGINKKFINKNKEEAINDGKASLKYAYISDSLPEEREKCITIDYHQFRFESFKNYFFVIDTPGCRDYIKNMIMGLHLAEAALLVVDATIENIEDSDFQRTKEYAVIAYILGIKQIIVVINKMDDKAVYFDHNRFNQIRDKLTDLLIKIGYKEFQFKFIPVSGFDGDNLFEKSQNLSWWNSGTLIELLDSFKKPIFPKYKPLRVSVQDVYQKHGIGTIIEGIVESGIIKSGQRIVVAPLGIESNADMIDIYGNQFEQAEQGEKTWFKVKISPEVIKRGFICGDPSCDPPYYCKSFTAEIIMLGPGKIIAGYQPVFDIHTAHICCKFSKLIQRIDRVNGNKVIDNPEWIQKNDKAIVIIEPSKPLVVEAFKDYPALGRFLVRDMKNLVAVGVIRSVEKMKPNS